MIEALTNERLAELRDGARMAVEQFPSAKDPRVRAMYQGFADACDELLALRASIEQMRWDTARIDWLQRKSWYDINWWLHLPTVHLVALDYHDKNLRAAIDSAMSTPSAGGG